MIISKDLNEESIRKTDFILSVLDKSGDINSQINNDSSIEITDTCNRIPITIQRPDETEIYLNESEDSQLVISMRNFFFYSKI